MPENAAAHRCNIGAGVKVNSKTRKGTNALQFAAKKGHVDVVRYLIRRKANVSAKDRNGKTAMDLASDEAVKAVLQEALNGPEQEKVNRLSCCPHTLAHWECKESIAFSQSWEQLLADTLCVLQPAGPSERLSEGEEPAETTDAQPSENAAAEQGAVPIGPPEQPIEKKERGNLRKRNESNGVSLQPFHAGCPVLSS